MNKQKPCKDWFTSLAYTLFLSELLLWFLIFAVIIYPNPLGLFIIGIGIFILIRCLYRLVRPQDE